MKCHDCNSPMTESHESYQYQESGLDNVYIPNASVYRCPCGESFASLPGVARINEMVGLSIIKKKGKLTGREVCFLRKNMGLNARNFAELMNVDNVTVLKWENGEQKIENIEDKLIRLIYANYKNIAPDECKKIIDESVKHIDLNKKVESICVAVEDFIE